VEVRSSKPCRLCNGVQWTYTVTDNDIVPKPCACLERKLLQEFLGPEIAHAKFIKSDLFNPVVDANGEESGDRTKENLFIKGPWSLVIRHLYWVLSGKKKHTPGYTFKVVSDKRLIEVFVGEEKGKRRADQEVNNGLSDLLTDPHLVICRLGVLTHANKAAANVLQEALNIRNMVGKPVWICEDFTHFGEGHPTYSQTVGDYIEENFTVEDLGGDIKEARSIQEDARALAWSSDSIAMDADAPKAEVFETSPEPKQRFRAKPKQWNNNWSGKKRKGGGGLPEY
jgi:hypothetical protein